MQDAADARARGMRLVGVDPMANFASAKANEWGPIRPGPGAGPGGRGRGAGGRARPAFALLREHVRQFTPEGAERISSVPPASIRRLAREFATEAMIGSTGVLDGKRLPYRPG